MAFIEGQHREQLILFPECIEDYISSDNAVRVIDEYVEQLNIKQLGFEKAVSAPTGRPPYNPKDMLKLYLYGYLNRVRSSRRLEQETTRNIEVIWLLKKLKPDFKTIADFRKDNKKALKSVFREFTKLCNEWNLYGKELAAIDGSKFRASNSKRNNYNDKKLEKRIEHIDEKIESYMQELEQGDALESGEKKLTADEIKEKLEELRKRKEKYEGYVKQLKETGQKEISTTDPDARRMCNNNNNVDVSYNIQTTVDSLNKLIVDFKVTQNPCDIGLLDNMALRAKKLFEGIAFEVLADKGYYKAEDLKKCVEKGITPYVPKQGYSNGTGDKEFYPERFTYNKDLNVYICPEGNELKYYRDRKTKAKGVIGHQYKNYAACQACKSKDRCTKSAKGREITRHIDQDFLDTINLQTDLNFDKYKLRQMIVEHPYGTIKRNWGAYYFLTRGRASVTTEMSITCLAYNMRRVLSILGVKEILKRLREKRESVLA